LKAAAKEWVSRKMSWPGEIVVAVKERVSLSTRKPLKSMLESRSGAALRAARAVQLAHRDSLAVGRLARQLDVSRLDYRNFFRIRHPKPSASKLFILGSGPSVNELSPKNFEEIDSEWSVGISHWLIHPFVPDAYSVEQAEDHRYSHVAKLLSDHLKNLTPLTLKPLSVLCLRPREILDAETLIVIPKSLQSQTFLYGRINPVTSNESNLGDETRFFFSPLGRRIFPSDSLLDNGSSVLRMVTLGILSGCKEIVLAGVDLNSQRYFWEADGGADFPSLPQSYDPWLSRGAQHETNIASNRTFTFEQVIHEIASLGETSGRWKLSVTSSKSGLARRLPRYVWRDEH